MNDKIKTGILPTAYLPPIQYLSVISNYDNVLIEQCETFRKQTIRNRCNIYTSNGMLSLIIPLKERRNHSVTKDIKISYDSNWQVIHWRSIESAYSNSPFFEFYKDEFINFYNSKFEFLIDFNFSILEKTMKILGLNPIFFCGF